jgi:hypothetical protein
MDRVRTAVPYLALADVFICAISIVFILLLLSQPQQPLLHQAPQADFIVWCDGNRALLGAADGIDEPVALSPYRIEPALAALTRGDSLSVRVLIRARPADMACATRLRESIRWLNDELSERLAGGESGAYLLDDLELISAPVGTDASD